MMRSLVGVAAAAAVVVVVMGAVLAIRGCSRESTGPSAVLGQDPAARIGAEGMAAKGTAELRALGCANAVVVDMQHLLGAGAAVHSDEPRYMVTCDVASGPAAPGCDRLAAAYFGAVGGTTDANVCVRVSTPGATKPTCSRLYAPNGVDLGPFPRQP